jgi:lycopene beta-cyclase
MSGKTYEHIIAGAGCAGLSLVWQLLEAGIDSRILLIDSRRNYVNDRTWCYWRVEDTPSSDLADHAWSSWEIHANETLQAVGACEDTPTCTSAVTHSTGEYSDRIVKSPQVSMVLGEDIHGYQRKAGQLVVGTGGGEYYQDVKCLTVREFLAKAEASRSTVRVPLAQGSGCSTSLASQ